MTLEEIDGLITANELGDYGELPEVVLLVVF